MHSEQSRTWLNPFGDDGGRGNAFGVAIVQARVMTRWTVAALILGMILMTVAAACGRRSDHSRRTLFATCVAGMAQRSCATADRMRISRQKHMKTVGRRSLLL